MHWDDLDHASGELKLWERNDDPYKAVY